MRILFLMCFLCTATVLLAQNGNVGIGTTTPQAQLHTTGSVRFDTLKGVGASAMYITSDGVLVRGVAKDTAANKTTQPIPEGTCAGGTSTITISGLPTRVPPSGISVKVNLTHTDTREVAIFLQSPAGRVINLFYGTRLQGSGLINTIFSDGGGFPVHDGVPPYTGTYKPSAKVVNYCVNASVESFNELGGLGIIDPNGNWTLYVLDENQNNITGQLTSWEITFSRQPAVPYGHLLKSGLANFSIKSIVYEDDSRGRIGIGSNAPAANLDVIGSTLGVRTAAQAYDNLWLQAEGLVASVNASGADQGLQFKVGNNTSGTYGNGQTLTTAMTLLPDGRVGIGTTTPISLLSNTTKNTIGSDGLGGNANSLSWSNAIHGYAAVVYNGANVSGGNGLAVKVNNTSSSALDVSTGSQESIGTSLFTVKSGGNVGVGVSNPTQKLEVAGTIKSTAINTAATNTPTTGSANMTAVAYGVVYAAATTEIVSSSNNCTLSHTPGTGIYTISFTSSNLSGVATGNLPIVISPYGNTPGFTSWTGGTGTITVYTFNAGGAATDRGFSFSVYKP